MDRVDLKNEIEYCAAEKIEWDKLDNKSIMVTGATGMVGKYLIEVLLFRKIKYGLSTKIYAVGRDQEKFKTRFSAVAGMEFIEFIEHDVQIPMKFSDHLDYIIHMASNTHPQLYASDPIGTEMSNIFGTYNLLSMIKSEDKCKFIFISSGDVYGDNRSDKLYIAEKDYGYVDCNTLRAGYTEGKRASEALCNAFKEEKGIDFVIGRLCRVYGPTVQMQDSKAITQFIMNAARGENIVLKSDGVPIFSYMYIYDVVTAIFMLMTRGQNGEAYNVSDINQCVSLANLASIIARIGEVDVIRGSSSKGEKKGASDFVNVRLDNKKLLDLGWEPKVCLEEGLIYTINQIKIISV